MTRKCAWCGQSLGLSDQSGDLSVTHGICRACSDALLRAAGLDPPTVEPSEGPAHPPTAPSGGEAG